MTADADAVRRAADEARRQWPGLDLPDFEDQLTRRLAAPGASVERLRAGDLWLATACLRRVRGAAEAFESAFGADLTQVARRFSGPRHPADDLRQIVLEKLLVGTPDRGPRLADYAGQGFLQNFVRVAALRIATDVVRRGVQHQREDAVEALEVAELADDVELGFLKGTYRARFKAAFADAVAALDPSDRTVLKLSYLHGLSIDELGSVLGVHRATAARRIGRAREQLLLRTRGGLRDALAIGDAELDSLLGGIQSRMEVSLERLLKTTLR